MMIGHREIGVNAPPFVIAEMSGNHNQSLERSLQIVEAVAAAGAHALKLQTYTPDSLTLPLSSGDFFIDDPKSPWHGSSLYELYQTASTPYEWHEQIFARAAELGLVVFSTPFDEEAVDFLEGLRVPCYKIASFENIHLPLIRKAASTGKPLIISTGMATVAELDEAVAAARGAGCRDLVLLKCTSSYPAPATDTNLRTIPHLRHLFEAEVGLSDHTLGTGVAVAAVALGATVIEKHVTLNRSEGGVDSAFSLEPNELARLVSETELAWQALGKISYGVLDAEQKSLRFRRSLYVTRDLRPGDVLTHENVRAIRPGFGLHPRSFDHVLGRTVRFAVPRGTALQWDLLA